MKNRLLAAVLALVLMIAPLTVPAYAYQPGEEIGQVLYTDIVAYIDGHAIRSYNINWNTYIVVEDLMAYGFAVSWLPEEGRLVIAKERTAAPESYTADYKPEANTHPAGTPAMPYLYTEITTWIGDTQVTGYNIGGFTCICMDDLAAHFAGEYVWSPEDKALYMTSLVFTAPEPDPAPETPALPEEMSSAAQELDWLLQDLISLYTENFFTDEELAYLTGLDELYSEDLLSPMLGIWRKFYREFTYTIHGAEENGDTAVVYLTITCRDMSEAISDYITLYLAEVLRLSMQNMEMSDEALTQLSVSLLVECASSPDLPFVARETEVHLVWLGEEWDLSEYGNDDFLDALMGGYLSSPILDAFLGAEEEPGDAVS